MDKKTTLIYFGSTENSKYGTLRSCIAFLLYVIVFFSLYVINKDFYNKLMNRKLNVFISIVVIVSAICVVVPTDNYDALKYGASVGACLSLIAISAWSDKFNWNSFAVFIFSTIIFALISLLVYIVSKNMGWYPFKPC